MPAKFIFLHILQGSRHLTSNSPTHWIAWLSCALGIVVIAYITASAIPVFDSRLRFPGLAGRLPARDDDVLPADGVHMVV